MKKKEPLKVSSTSKSPYNSEQLLAGRAPIFSWLLLTYIATMVLQNLEQPMLINSLLFTFLLSLHLVLYSFINTLKERRPWVYIVIQAILSFLCSFVMPDGYAATLIGLYSLLIGLSVGIYYQASKVLIVALFCIVLTCLATFLMGHVHMLFTYLMIMIPLIISVVGYAVMFFRQVQNRFRIQKSLHELELAHQKVEELTLANERQRMARDLHDTLAQGLAGLIMQLEAIDAHLSNDNVKRGKEIVQQAMERARVALANARSAIDDLRTQSVEELGFIESVEEEVQRFRSTTGINCVLTADAIMPLSSMFVEQAKHIISEGLTNIARHSQAKCAWITIEEKTNGILYVEIKDDGVGFNSEKISKQVGHYGLLGMKERVRILKGTIDVQSKVQKGTIIQIEVPIQKGE
ncbi:sensor histidine kinase [Priestia megaterium]